MSSVLSPRPGVQPRVLLFNFAADSRTMRLLRFLDDSGTAVTQVPSCSYYEKLGALFALPGYEKSGVRHFGTPFQDEMLVMAGFDQVRLDALLHFFRDEKLPPVALKALLTPTNADWDAVTLHSHMLQERDQFLRAGKR